MRILLRVVLASLLLPAPVWADDPPEVEFQPSPCSVPDRPMSLCAFVSDDVQIGVARVYFRPQGDKYFFYVDMAFGGLNYCATLPAPSEKLKVLEYYVQAVDSEYQAQRTSTYQLNIQPEGVCGFPPVEEDAQKAASITVHAMNRKQGKKLPNEFVSTGVTYIPKEH